MSVTAASVQVVDLDLRAESLGSLGNIGKLIIFFVFKENTK
jgi:hypothetical protein